MNIRTTWALREDFGYQGKRGYGAVYDKQESNIEKCYIKTERKKLRNYPET